VSGAAIVPWKDSTEVRYEPGGLGVTTSAANTAKTMVQALAHVRRVVEIMEKCCIFWNNMDACIERLSQLKEHTERLIQYSSKSTRLQERFKVRLEGHEEFWQSLEGLSTTYVQRSVQDVVSTRSQLNKLENAADVLATGLAFSGVTPHHSADAVRQLELRDRE